MDNISVLRCVSYGIVAANKALNSNEVMVSLLEQFPRLDGTITGNPQEYSSSRADQYGVKTDHTVQTTDSVVAHWLPLGEDHRMTAPDVMRGEPVVIYQFADVDKYYWITLKNDKNFRKLETVVYAFSGTKDFNAKPDDSNCYLIEVSTHKGYVRLLTSQANAEPFGYSFMFNTKEGNVKLNDHVGNALLFNSVENQLRYDNIAGSVFDIHQDIMDINIQNINIKTNNYNFESSNSNIKAGSTSHDGPIEQKGDYSMTGNHSVAGNTAVTGGGSSTFSGLIKGDADFELSGHIAATSGDFSSYVKAPNLKYT